MVVLISCRALDGYWHFPMGPMDSLWDNKTIHVCVGTWQTGVAGPLEGQLQTTCQSVLHLNHLPIAQPAGYTPLSM